MRVSSTMIQQHIKRQSIPITILISPSHRPYRGDPAISTTILVESGIAAGVPFSNQGGYANAELDAVIAKAAHEIDEEQRTALYHQFQQLVEADLPLINVAEWGFITVANDRVKNVSNNPRWAVSNWADVFIAQ